MSADSRVLAATALAPIIWGSSYMVISTTLPEGYPLTMAALRALTGGLVLMLLVRQLPRTEWFSRIFLLGALNFTIFWAALFIASSRLPGGIAAILLATQSLFIIVLARYILGSPIHRLSIIAALTGIGGIAILLIDPSARLDPIGCIAALVGSFAMACGMVLTRKWQPKESLTAMTAWQLLAGGILLTPIALIAEPGMPAFDGKALGGIAYLGILGAAVTYILWFRGLSRLAPSVIGTLGFLSPLTAVLLGAVVMAEWPEPGQWLGIAMILGSIWVSQQAHKPTNKGATLTPVAAKGR